MAVSEFIIAFCPFFLNFCFVALFFAANIYFVLLTFRSRYDSSRDASKTDKSSPDISDSKASNLDDSDPNHP